MRRSVWMLPHLELKTALWSLFAFCILMIPWVCHRLENVRPRPGMITGDEDLTPFHVDVASLNPIGFNIDSNRLEYEYETALPELDTFPDVIAARAQAARWKEEQSTATTRTYSKITTFNDYYDHELVVTVEWIPGSRRVSIVQESRGLHLPRATGSRPRPTEAEESDAEG